MEDIILENVSKDYIVHYQPGNVLTMAKKLFKPEKKIVHAVKNLSFTINSGERVGLIGENGAGKSSTIKMITGIIVPSSGNIMVKGLMPYKNRKENARNIGVVFGQKSRLIWELPVQDSFGLYKEIYQINDYEYKRRVNFFVEMMGMGGYLNTPIRELSLGQRMKAELALAMLHNPAIMFLDEPTIGLDVLAKRNVRDFLIECNKEMNTTIMLTSHDMKDLDIVVDRIIMLNHGQLLFDGSIKKFKEEFTNKRNIGIYFVHNIEKEDFSNRLFDVLEQKENRLIISFDTRIKFSEIIAFVENICQVQYFEERANDIEDIVREIYINNK